MTPKMTYPALAVRRCAAIVAGLAGVASALSQTYTDAQLLAEGEAAWQQARCVRAARFLFAYELRNSRAMQSDPNHRNSVRRAIEWCEQNTAVAAGTKGDAAGEVGAARTPKRPDLQLRPSSPAGAAPTAASPEARRKHCVVYAHVAIAQQAANKQNGCGFADGRWSGDYAYHFNWCLQAQPGPVQAGTAERALMLEDCAR
jgi:hypothetical protein